MDATVARPPETRGKIWYLEWLRVFACLAVVLIHSFATLLDNSSVAEVGMPRALVWTEILVVFCRWAVPVFLMVTGALLLDPSREIGWRKVGRYVSRVVAVLLTFGFMYALMEIVFNSRSLKASMIPIAILNVLQGRGWNHFWYLYDLLGVYLLLPLLRSFASIASERDLRAMLAVLFAFSLTLPTVNAASGLELESLIWLGASVFYVLLGYYLNSYEVPTAPVVIAGVASVAVQALLAGGYRDR